LKEIPKPVLLFELVLMNNKKSFAIEKGYFYP